MSYTTIPNLTTKDPASGEIQNGDGFEKDVTFFYWQDIKKVIEQSPNVPISNLKLVSIRFDREEPEGEIFNHERYEITGLALRKTEEEIGAILQEFGELNNEIEGRSKWHDIVALAWPVYYKGSTTDLRDSENEKAEYNGQLFLGSEGYIPGRKLNK